MKNTKTSFTGLYFPIVIMKTCFDLSLDHYRPDDDLSDRSKHVVIITIGKYSPVKDVLVFFM